MAGCTGGAIVRPGYTAGNVILSVAGAGILAVNGVAELAPFLVEDPVIGSIAAQGLCQLNPDDPGDFQLSYLASPTYPGDLPSPLSQSGTMSWWIWHKTVYWFFQQTCQCVTSGQPPPAPVTITPITNYDVSYSLTQNRTQLTEIQASLSTGSSGQRQLYDLAERNWGAIAEVYGRTTPLQARMAPIIATGVTGEGYVDLPLGPFPPQTAYSQPYTHIGVRVQQISSAVGVRGTLEPRLYGVGTIMMAADTLGGGRGVITERHPIHYWQEVWPVPQNTQIYRLIWRIMPGCVVDIFGAEGAYDNVIIAPSPDTSVNYLPSTYSQPGPGYVDPPTYPAAARSITPVAGGATDELRLDPRSLAVPEQVLTDIPSDREGCGCSGSV